MQPKIEGSINNEWVRHILRSNNGPVADGKLLPSPGLEGYSKRHRAKSMVAGD